MSLSEILYIYVPLFLHDLPHLCYDLSQTFSMDEKIMLEFDDALYDLRTNIDTYKIRKTLYVASENVIDLEIGKYLTMINKNIYRYLDMKIVIEGM